MLASIVAVLPHQHQGGAAGCAVLHGMLSGMAGFAASACS